MYIDVAEQDDLSQGDIVNDVVFGYVPTISNPVLYNEDGDRVNRDLADPLSLHDNLDMMIPAEKSRVMILSQACDCLSKPYLCVARIVPLQTFDRGYAEKIASKRATVKSTTQYIQDVYQRAGAKPDAFYLQERERFDFPKSVVSFLQLHSITASQSNTGYLKENRLMRLNDEAVLDLQFRLGFYFGRFATTENYMLTSTERESLSPTVATTAEPQSARRR
jgi:hypothetical protein